MPESSITDKAGKDAIESFALFVSSIQPQEEDMLKAGNWLIEKRRRETLEGRDVDGGDFSPYSAVYVKRKDNASVNLYSSRPKGRHMLDALEAIYDRNTSSLEVGIFADPEMAMRAQALNEGALVRVRGGRYSAKAKSKGKSFISIPARHWLGASDSDLTEMARIEEDSAAARVNSQGK